MRGRLLAPAMLSLIVVAGFAIGGAGAATRTRRSSCTATQKSQRLAALATFEKQMTRQRKSYFAHHRSVKLRRAFVRQQQARLKQLQALAACTAQAPTSAARLAQLHTYSGAMTALMPLFDPESAAAADDALTTITTDEENCDTDPAEYDCPVPASEYQATAKSLRDAAAGLKRLSDKLALTIAPTMTVAEYSDTVKAAAADCGVDLTTVAAAHKKFLNVTNKWVTTLGDWADTYAAGKSVDWDTVDDYLPGSSAIWEQANDAVVLWGVMVTAYWNSLAERVSPAPDIPTWISDLYDGECPTPE